MARYGARKVEHFTGARRTHVTYEGVSEDEHGSRVVCGHQGHRTVLAAATCAKRRSA